MSIPRTARLRAWLPLLKGAATFVPGVHRALSRARTGGTDSARYCYSVWLRHLVLAARVGLGSRPATVAELGPGDSLGIGLASLLTGAQCYHALDVVPYAGVTGNLRVFEELVALFRARTPIPDEQEFPLVFPRLEDYRFPADLLPEDRLARCLSEERLQRIRRSIAAPADPSSCIRYHVPWHRACGLERGSVDVIFSQAVLEHVDDVEDAYQRMMTWLRPGGYVSHTIDFGSHGSAAEWNGHWRYPDWLWTLVRGRRPYYINRLPLSFHRHALVAAGFDIVAEVTADSASRLREDDVRHLAVVPDERDRRTRLAFIQARKPAHSAAGAGG